MGEIDRPPAPKASASGSAGGGTLNGAEADRFQRGLDSGLAKAAPSATGLNQKIYQSQKKVRLVCGQCFRRGKDVAIEGAYLVLSQLQDVA